MKVVTNDLVGSLMGVGDVTREAFLHQRTIPLALPV